MDKCYDKEIRDAVTYINEQRARKRPNKKIQGERAKRIMTIQTGVKKVERQLAKLLQHIVDKDDDWHTPTGEAYITHAYQFIASALAPLSDALAVARPQPASKRSVEGRMATRLAYSICGESNPREIRKVAHKIIKAANIKCPDQKSLTNWIKEAKEWGQRKNGK